MQGELKKQGSMCQGSHWSNAQSAFFWAKPLVGILELFTQGLLCSIFYHGIEKGRESQNPRMVWVGRAPKDHLIPTPIVGRDTFHWTKLSQAPSNLTLNTSRHGTSAASQGNLFQCLIQGLPLIQCVVASCCEFADHRNSVVESSTGFSQVSDQFWYWNTPGHKVWWGDIFAWRSEIKAAHYKWASNTWSIRNFSC